MATQQRLWLSSPNPWEALLNKDFLLGESCGVQNIPQGKILPPRPRVFPKETEAPWAGGVLDKNGKWLAGISRHALSDNHLPDWGDCAGTYPTLSQEWQTLNEDVIFGGILLGQFGHFLVESLARLWWIVENPQDSRRIVFLKGEGWWQTAAAGGGGAANLTRNPTWLSDFLALLNIPAERILWLSRPTTFKSILLPDAATHSFSGFYPQYVKMCAKIAQNADKMHENAPKFNKIYLTYSHSPGNAQCVNENLFEDFFRAQGFEIIAPETLPISRQIHLLFNAQEVASTIGTTAHLTMFCRPNTKFFGLLRTNTEANIPQMQIHRAFALDFYLIDVTLNFLPTHPTFGVRNLYFSPMFEAFSKAFFPHSLPLIENLKKQIDHLSYLKAWTDLHSLPGNFHSYLNDKTAFDFVNTLSTHLNHKPLNYLDFYPVPSPFLKRLKRQSVIFLRQNTKKILKKILPYPAICFLYAWAQKTPQRARICGVPFSKK